MRLSGILFAVFALMALPAMARDDIMPPPNSAPRIPVEQQKLGGSSEAPLTALQRAKEAKEAKAAEAAAAKQPVTALGRSVKGKGEPVTRTAAATPAKPEPKKAEKTPEKTAEKVADKDPHEIEGKGQALDGERITVAGREIRLFGVVTPALTSSFGPQTRLNLDRMLSNSNVLCKMTNTDADGRPVAFCGTVKVPDLSYEMLRQGWAMVDRRTLKGNALSDVYEKAEQEAQAQNRGIFAPAPMAMTVPLSNPGKASVSPTPAPTVADAVSAVSGEPAAAAEPEVAQAAPEPVAPAPEPEVVAKPAARAVATSSSDMGFVERYQILLGACILMLAAVIFGCVIVWREQKAVTDRRRALAAALRGELMSARLICRTRAKDLLSVKKADIEAKHPGQLWPRIRSVVYQAHVSHLGLLGAELARQVASVYGQCADYAAYYQSNAVRMPIPHVVGETLNTLAEHMDTLMYGLQEVENTGRALLGDDIMAEEDQRAAAENVRLAVAAAHKRSLPPPTVTPETIKSVKQPRRASSKAAAAVEALEADEEADDEEPAPAQPVAKSSKSPRVA
jgi:endonuclease YncB( thermonuclease family)